MLARRVGGPRRKPSVVKREIRFSVRAEEDLDFISAFTGERFGLAQERKYRERLLRAFQMLLTFPNLGTDQSESGEGLRRTVHERHAVYYSVHPFGILIERILGPGQDPAREFEPD